MGPARMFLPGSAVALDVPAGPDHVHTVNTAKVFILSWKRLSVCSIMSKVSLSIKHAIRNL